jgi:CBS domain-containing protein
MNVSTILKQKGRSVATVQPTTTLMEATTKLAAKKIGAIVVTDNDGRVTGIISERDIVRVIAQGGAEVLSTTVGDVMTRNVITCAETATLNDIMTIMTHGRFRHLPVVDGDGKLSGIISIGDVVKLHVGEISMEADAMREYIASH